MEAKDPLKPYANLVEEFIKDVDKMNFLHLLAKTDSERHLIGYFSILMLCNWMLVVTGLLAQMYGWDKIVE